jgi:hypothetical protein
VLGQRVVSTPNATASVRMRQSREQNRECNMNSWRENPKSKEN